MQIGESEVRACAELAGNIRRDVLRMTYEKKAGFIGTSFSCAEILAVLFRSFLELDARDPDSEKNDVFILSKGHGASALYAALANIGAFGRERLFEEFNEAGYNMGVHPKRGALPGVPASTGSLGQGLGLACGVALADKIAKRGRRVFVLLGDGECNEGSVWESFMLANRYGLGKLTAIIDRNRLQSYGHDCEVLDMGDMGSKIKSFGWNVIAVDGHDCGRLIDAYSSAIGHGGGPTAIVANTIKGKGVSAFEDKVLWHYKWPEDEHMAIATSELG
ncbi:MAG: transketolase [Synergistaceae bacterium]|jgi:transketolase|nr:transketolase [Synergistaceae bacterium]